MQGVGSDHAWVVSVGEQASALSEQLTSYTAPIVYSVGGLGTQQAQTTGGQGVSYHSRTRCDTLRPSLAVLARVQAPAKLRPCRSRWCRECVNEAQRTAYIAHAYFRSAV